jgi:carboxypeptidase family protein
MKSRVLLGLVIAFFAAACHPEPVFDAGHGPKQPPVGGTVAGLVTTVDSTLPVIGRRVTATEVATHQTYTATTAANGGYTIKVPKGTYHLEIELHQGEVVTLQPKDTQINNGDLDPHRNFVISAAKTAR